MADTRQVGSQLTNMLTYKLEFDENLSLAKNVFKIKYLPNSIDIGYINGKLIRDGAVAFFIDEDENLEKKLFALPFNVITYKKPYNKPYKIEAIGENNYKKVLKEDEFVIMYDNTEKRPIIMDIMQYSERLSVCTRTCDINILQQRTPRTWLVPADKEKTFRDLINNIDSFQETVIGYEGLNIEGVNCVLEPAPYVADKVDTHYEKIYNKFLSFIGISSLRVEKKERLISDEIEAQNGGSIASRFSRFTPRYEAIQEINKKFAKFLEKPLELEYYDGEPKSTESEVDKNVSNVSNVSNNDGNS